MPTVPPPVVHEGVECFPGFTVNWEPITSNSEFLTLSMSMGDPTPSIWTSIGITTDGSMARSNSFIAQYTQDGVLKQPKEYVFKGFRSHNPSLVDEADRTLFVKDQANVFIEEGQVKTLHVTLIALLRLMVIHKSLQMELLLR
jgi:hypothetical protein